MRLQDLNKKAAHYGLELVKGDGYFYWWGLNDEANYLLDEVNRDNDTSVYVNAFTHMDKNQWMQELKEITTLIQK